MLTIPWGPRARQLMLVAAVLPLLAACDPGTTTVDTTSSRCRGYDRPPPWCRTSGGGQPATVGKQPAGGSTTWDAGQRANAALIVAIGRERGVPRRGHVIALATAMQESSLRNLGHQGARNDHDSLGLFQQRPSQGWGTPAQVSDPRYAAGRFYDKLLRVRGWQAMPIWMAAQSVQRSAYPIAYDKWVSDADQLAG